VSELEETMKWASERIKEQAVDIGKQRDEIEQLERDKAALESDLFEIRSLIRPIMDNSTAIFEHSVGIKAKHPPSTD
jgi:predicted  nucleic acid-binding Zn-ribbon protein